MASETQPAVDFYDALAPLFDVMTDWEARLLSEGPFLRAQLEAAGARRVLDAACGSGGHALALASWGYDAVGADPSPVMIDLARSKAAEAGLRIPFHVADLVGVAGLDEAPFDAVLCLGNSLVHLLTDADLHAALSGLAAALRPGGLLIVHNLNYDLRWRAQPRFFAAQGGELAGQQVLVWRFADYDTPAVRIAFHVALFRRQPTGWQVEVHTTPQRPWQHAELTAALAAAGFEGAVALGRMCEPVEPFAADSSGDLVLVARKRS
jgi:SAM-dependent methyltransferase